MQSIKQYNKRTLVQNSSIHLWFDQIADYLTESGFEQQITIGTMDVPWSGTTVKSAFKSIGRKQFKKGKTSEMNTKELSQVAETFIRFYAKKGLELPPFPSLESIINQQEHE